jgi:hypothetical protein
MSSNGRTSSVPRTAPAYERLRRELYATPARIVELTVPPVRAITVLGGEPPRSRQFQDAVALLFTVAYQLKMGMKFGTVRRPRGYFDFKVGPLETLWWSTGASFEINNARTVRWQAYLMVPAFVTRVAFTTALQLARTKAPKLAWAPVSLETLREGRSLQLLHVGPWNREGPTIERLRVHADARAMPVTGRHHEIYLSDPRRTKPARLRTIIRLGVGRPQRRQRRLK